MARVRVRARARIALLQLKADYIETSSVKIRVRVWYIDPRVKGKQCQEDVDRA